tara:strand:+ start:253 stop:621 length:369 start_codon:yes stop_codon:yes gene_type:complete
MRDKVIAFDLDDVICYRDEEDGRVEKYRSCKPYYRMIKTVNQCHDQGAYIVIYTARGMTSFNGDPHDIYDNLYQITKEQLDDWGVKYHKLVMGKLHYDLLIDDKAVNSHDIRDADYIKEILK